MEKLKAMGELTLEEDDPRSKRQTISHGGVHQGSQAPVSRDMTSNLVPQASVSAVWRSRPPLNEVMLQYSWGSPPGVAGSSVCNAYNHPNNQAFSQITRDSARPVQSVSHHALRAAPPACQPLLMSLPGHNNSTPYQPVQGFVPHQSVQSAPSFRKVPPWRIDKCYRYTTASASRTGETRLAQSISTSKGQWRGSPTPKVRQYDLRPQAPRMPSPTPGLKKGSRSIPYRGLPEPLPVPIPSEQYLAMASQPPNKLVVPKMLLIVLDLNGTLLCRKLASKSYSPRPSLDRFLAYCLENHKVLIWSSAKAVNVEAICGKIFSPEQRRKLLGIWARESLGLSESQYEGKVQIYKRLTSIWDHKAIQYEHPDFDRGGCWSQENTILIDDSLIKAKGHPYNLIQCPEFVTSRSGEEVGDVLGQIVAYLEEARWCDNASSFIKNIYKFEVDNGWAWDWERNQRQKTTDEAFGSVQKDKILGLSTADGHGLVDLGKSANNNELVDPT